MLYTDEALYEVLKKHSVDGDLYEFYESYRESLSVQDQKELDEQIRRLERAHLLKAIYGSGGVRNIGRVY